jgi:hypothetical protein
MTFVPFPLQNDMKPSSLYGMRGLSSGLRLLLLTLTLPTISNERLVFDGTILTECTDDTVVLGRPNLYKELYSLLLVSARHRQGNKLETSSYDRGSNGLRDGRGDTSHQEVGRPVCTTGFGGH